MGNSCCQKQGTGHIEALMGPDGEGNNKDNGGHRKGRRAKPNGYENHDTTMKGADVNGGSHAADVNDSQDDGTTGAGVNTGPDYVNYDAMKEIMLGEEKEEEEVYANVPLATDNNNPVQPPRQSFLSRDQIYRPVSSAIFSKKSDDCRSRFSSVGRASGSDILRAQVRILATSPLQQYVGTGLPVHRPPRGRQV